MKKSKLKDNTLIKKKNIVLTLNKAGIKRINSDAILSLEKHFSAEAEEIADILKEEMITHGRRTLQKEDVHNALKKLKKEETFWEV